MAKNVLVVYLLKQPTDYKEKTYVTYNAYDEDFSLVQSGRKENVICFLKQAGMDTEVWDYPQLNEAIKQHVQKNLPGGYQVARVDMIGERS